jgi:predicted oxidoreductase
VRELPINQMRISDSRLALGCMGFGDADPSGSRASLSQAMAAFDTACEIGITLFDHADIYREGRAEAAFGEWLKARPGLRDRLCIQSKCGIRPGRYDFSAEHILASVDGSLRRLGISCLDILLLHRPDPLMEPDEIAATFASLKASGKVRYFGVSNMNAAQVRWLQHHLPDPLVVNQLEMNLVKLDWLEQGVLVNQDARPGMHFGEGLLEHCRLEGIQLQAWRPLAQGQLCDRLPDDAPERLKRTAERVHTLAAEMDTTPESIVLGWLMRHPAGIQPVIGTTRPERILACRDAVRVGQAMSREQWYSLYVMSRGGPLP